MLFQALLQPRAHIVQAPGKLFASRVSHTYNYWLQVPTDKLIIVKEIAQMVHDSSML